MPAIIYVLFVAVLAVVAIKCWLKFDQIIFWLGALAVAGGMLFATASAIQSAGDAIWRIGSIAYGLGTGFLGCVLMAISRLFAPKSPTPSAPTAAPPI